MSPKILSGTIHREIKMNIGVCEIYLALEAMRHNNAIYVYIVCAMMRQKKSDKWVMYLVL